MLDAVVLAYALGYEVMRLGGHSSKQLSTAEVVPVVGAASNNLTRKVRLSCFETCFKDVAGTLRSLDQA